MAVVTPEDLKRYMSGLNMSTPQMQGAQDVIDGIQSDLEMYINRPIEFALFREVCSVDADGVANTSRSPITKVDGIVFVPSYIYGEQFIESLYQSEVREALNLPVLPETPELPSHDLVAVEYGKYSVIPGGIDLNPLPSQNRHVVVTYWAGGGAFMAPYMKSIRLAILRVASREFQQMNDDTMSLRNASATPPVDPIPVAARGWRPEELGAFDRIRRRVIA